MIPERAATSTQPLEPNPECHCEADHASSAGLIQIKECGWPRNGYLGHSRFSRARCSPLASKVVRNTSKITAVDQPNIRTPFIAVIGPSRDQRLTGVTSP